MNAVQAQLRDIRLPSILEASLVQLPRTFSLNTVTSLYVDPFIAPSARRFGPERAAAPYKNAGLGTSGIRS